MRSRLVAGGSLLVALVAGAIALGGPAASAQDDSGSNDVLRIGWAQDAKTLNPFVGVNEEDYTIWAINWELLLNFDPEDALAEPRRSPRAGTSPRTSKTVTFDLIRGAKWSDGEPITSADVKWSLEVLGGNGLPVHVLHRQRHLDQDARRPHGVIETSQARRADDRRPVHLHPARAHLGQGAAEGR